MFPQIDLNKERIKTNRQREAKVSEEKKKKQRKHRCKKREGGREKRRKSQTGEDSKTKTESFGPKTEFTAWH